MSFAPGSAARELGVGSWIPMTISRVACLGSIRTEYPVLGELVPESTRNLARFGPSRAPVWNRALGAESFPIHRQNACRGLHSARAKSRSAVKTEPVVPHPMVLPLPAAGKGVPSGRGTNVPAGNVLGRSMRSLQTPGEAEWRWCEICVILRRSYPVWV